MRDRKSPTSNGAAMRYFFDTEFIDDGHTIDLASIGVVGEDGRKFYAESSDFDPSRANNWVRQNVLPRLTGQTLPRPEIARQLTRFAADCTEWWAYFGAYDWVALCQLFGPMLALPRGWPLRFKELDDLALSKGVTELERLIPPPLQAHNSLSDAVWVGDSHTTLSAMPYML